MLCWCCSDRRRERWGVMPSQIEGGAINFNSSPHRLHFINYIKLKLSGTVWFIDNTCMHHSVRVCRYDDPILMLWRLEEWSNGWYALIRQSIHNGTSIQCFRIGFIHYVFIMSTIQSSFFVFCFNHGGLIGFTRTILYIIFECIAAIFGTFFVDVLPATASKGWIWYLAAHYSILLSQEDELWIIQHFLAFVLWDWMPGITPFLNVLGILLKRLIDSMIAHCRAGYLGSAKNSARCLRAQCSVREVCLLWYLVDRRRCHYCVRFPLNLYL